MSTSGPSSPSSLEWRDNLLAIPPAERCATVEDLAVSLQLLDDVTEHFTNLDPNYEGIVSDATISSFLSYLEIIHRRFGAVDATVDFSPQVWTRIKAEFARNGAFQSVILGHSLGIAGREATALHVAGVAAFMCNFFRYMMQTSEMTARQGAVMLLEEFETIKWPQILAAVGQLDPGRPPDAYLESFGVSLRFQDLCSMCKCLRLYFVLGSNTPNEVLPELLALLRQLNTSAIPANWFEFYWSSEWLLFAAGLYSAPGSVPAAVASLRRQIAQSAWEVGLKYLEAAEQEDPADPARVFYTASHLAEMATAGLSPASFTLGDLEDVMDKHNAAQDACSAWILPFYAKAAADRSRPATSVVAAIAEARPSSYRDMTMADALTVWSSKGPIYRPGGPADRAVGASGAGAAAPKCAWCGKTGGKQSRCGGCKKVTYCDRTCQHNHWKEGHKAECGGAAGR